MAKTTVLKVSDMSCGHCELSVQEALDELDGLERAKADHATGDVEVAYDEGQVSVEQMGETIEESATPSNLSTGPLGRLSAPGPKGRRGGVGGSDQGEGGGVSGTGGGLRKAARELVTTLGSKGHGTPSTPSPGDTPRQRWR